MCQLERVIWDRELDEADAVPAERIFDVAGQFGSQMNGYLMGPFFGYPRDRDYSPERAPYFRADRKPSRTHTHGFYAYPCLPQVPPGYCWRTVFGAVSLFGRVMYGTKRYASTHIFVAELMRLDALFVPKTLGLADDQTSLAMLLAQYPDIPILEA